MRTIAVITSARSDYGLLHSIMEDIRNDPALRLQLFVTGMHLSKTFGMTIREIEKDGFSITARVPILEESDTERSIAQTMGRAMIGFAHVYAQHRPDILLVVGDRFEILAAAAAAVPFRIPIAHIHGGEKTEGLIDEQMRHALTKISHIHFTSTAIYRRRVIQMGEAPDRVFHVGAPGLDTLARAPLLNRSDLTHVLGVPKRTPFALVTYHPVTLEKNTAIADIRELLRALEVIHDIYWIFTFPNTDTEGRGILRAVEKFVSSHHENSRLFASLGYQRYFSALKYAALMVGNSSSGIIEAPSFRLPVVNIGDRQRGRVRARNVIDVEKCTARTIIPAIQKALTKTFRQSLKKLRNPYGEGNASKQVVHVLKTVPLGADLIKKQFYDIAWDHSGL